MQTQATSDDADDDAAPAVGQVELGPDLALLHLAELEMVHHAEDRLDEEQNEEDKAENRVVVC